MSYIHQSRGRMRIRSLAVKKHPECVSALETMLLRKPGVISAKVNPATGSVLIQYADNATDAGTLLQTLQEWGFLPEQTATPRQEHGNVPPVARAVIHMAIEKAIEKAVEHSLIRLVATLL